MAKHCGDVDGLFGSLFFLDAFNFGKLMIHSPIYGIIALGDRPHCWGH